MEKLKKLRETLQTAFFYFLPKLTWSYGIPLIDASVFDVPIN